MRCAVISDKGRIEVMQASIHCRLDYCNAILTGTADILMKGLQSIQNAAVCLMSGASLWDHISVPRSFHWLPMWYIYIFYSPEMVATGKKKYKRRKSKNTQISKAKAR